MNIKDIAKLANTSVSTVSRSLNDSDLVAEATKQRVREIAEKVGFEFNSSARGLVTQNTGTIGIILPDNYDKFSTKLYHSSLHNDLRKSLERAEKDLIVAFRHNRFSGQNNIVKLVNRKKMDGLIIVQPDLDKETHKFLEEKQMPFVMSHYPPKNSRVTYDVIYTDQEYGGYIVGEYLVQLGHKNILGISSDSEFQEEFDWREKGFRRALQLNGVELKKDAILFGDGAFQSGYDVIVNNAKRLQTVDAVFAFNDLMAWGAIRGLQKLGIQVPGDISVIGYDDTEVAEYSNPPLTTVHQPREELALLTCEHLFELIDQKNRKTEKQGKKIIGLQPNLVIRESCSS